MDNPNLRAILYQIMEDSRKEKICLIENIMRAKKSLVGMGEADYSNILNNPTAEFDRLYELSINTLELIDGIVSTRLNRKMLQRIAEMSAQ